MKILVASDIHGNVNAYKKVQDFFMNEDIDKMIVLGDVFSNCYGIGVDDNELNILFSRIITKLQIVKGNCDSKYNIDECCANFTNDYDLIIDPFHLYFMHGDRLFKDSMNDVIRKNVYFSGHTHVSSLYKENNKIFVNPGSVGRPRDGTKGTFCVFSKKNVTIYDLNYKIITEYYFN